MSEARKEILNEMIKIGSTSHSLSVNAPIALVRRRRRRNQRLIDRRPLDYGCERRADTMHDERVYFLIKLILSLACSHKFRFIIFATRSFVTMDRTQTDRWTGSAVSVLRQQLNSLNGPAIKVTADDWTRLSTAHSFTRWAWRGRRRWRRRRGEKQ